MSLPSVAFHLGGQEYPLTQEDYILWVQCLLLWMQMKYSYYIKHWLILFTSVSSLFPIFLSSNCQPTAVAVRRGHLHCDIQSSGHTTSYWSCLDTGSQLHRSILHRVWQEEQPHRLRSSCVTAARTHQIFPANISHACLYHRLHSFSSSFYWGNPQTRPSPR